MKIRVHRIDPQAWKERFSHSAHLVVFGELKDPESERISYALLTTNEEDTPLHYVTVRELDSQTVYFQYGGSFPSSKGSVVSWLGFKSILDWLKDRYSRVTFLAENSNFPMLKLGMMAGFVISGIRVFRGTILLEHGLELQGRN